MSAGSTSSGGGAGGARASPSQRSRRSRRSGGRASKRSVSSTEYKQRLYSLAATLNTERSMAEKAEAEVRRLKTALTRLNQLEGTARSGQQPAVSPMRSAGSNSYNRFSARPSTSGSGKQAALLAATAATGTRPRTTGGTSQRSAAAPASERLPPNTFFSTKRVHMGQPYFGRVWCDLTRSMEHGTHPPVSNDPSHFPANAWFPRETSHNTKAIINYECMLQSPYTRKPPGPGGMRRKRCDMTRHSEKIMWSLRNRYPRPAAKSK